MFTIEGNKITMPRGDTLKAVVSMQSGSTVYTPQAGDVVKFALKKLSRNIISKTIPNDTLLLELTPDDTKNLPIGEYRYTLKLTYANGDVDTFIDSLLTLNREG